MLAKRIIPTMLVRGRTLVKGRQFAGDRSIGHAQQAARVHAMRGVDELLILDIGATAEGRGPDLDLVRALSEGCFVPITVGGGVKTIKDIDALLRAGADKVAIGRGWEEDQTLIPMVSERFGRQAIVCMLDVGQYGPGYHPEWAASNECCMKSAPIHAKTLENWGAGEIVVQAMHKDGEMTGYDLDLIQQIVDAVDIPVIASGGCSGYPDMAEAIKRGASAVAAGALFAFTDATPRGAAQYLHEHGITVRMP